MKIEALHVVKGLIAHGAIIMVVLHAFYDRFAVQKGKRLVIGALVALAGLSCFALYDFGHYLPQKLDQASFKLDHHYPYVNRHDFFHYYMGSKYSREVGYLHLYPCALIVDRENEPQFEKKGVRDQEDYDKFPTIAQVMAKKDFYKSLFSEERWKEFESDTLFFRGLMGKGRWQKALRDKGYNATPTWNVVVRPITNALPVAETLSRDILMWLDISLAIIMFGFIFWAFGWRTALFAITFFGVNFMISETHIKGSLLRWDWVTFLTIAICFLKKGYYVPAGALVGYAAMARIFPLIFVFGMGAKALWVFIDSRKIVTPYLRFFIAFGIVAASLLGASVVADGGTEQWAKYRELISMHNDDVVGVRAGFKYVFLSTQGYEGSERTYKEKKNQEFHDRQITWWMIQIGVLIGSFFLVRRLEDYESVAFGFVPAYFLVAPTFYYYIMLIVPLLLFAPKITDPRRAIGLCLLFFIAIAGYEMYPFLKLSYALFYWLSLMYLGFAAYIMYIAFHADSPVSQDPTPEKAI